MTGGRGNGGSRGWNLHLSAIPKEDAGCSMGFARSEGFISPHHYPDCSKANGDMPGTEAHSDSSVLSILCEDELGRLELYKVEQ
ncbi:Fe2OG dioxygenase domain-containing protein [Psidium guajava]|nr:Fe2OG dioxygenase domain-containing protein [Psidium guajava]